MGTRDDQQLIQAWLNPDIPQDAQVIEIVNDLREKGFNAKQIIVGAILEAGGVEPEQFGEAADPLAAMILRNVRKIVSSATKRQSSELEAIIRETLRNASVSGDESVTPNAEVTHGMANLASAFRARQRKADDQ